MDFIFFWTKHIYDSLTCNGEYGTSAADAVPPVGLLWNNITLVACLAPSRENWLHCPTMGPLGVPCQ